MDRKREEAMAKARQKRQRREGGRKARKKVKSEPDGLASQVKDVAVAAVEKVGHLVKSATGAIADAVVRRQDPSPRPASPPA
jgi:hypothetical protein